MSHIKSVVNSADSFAHLDTVRNEKNPYENAPRGLTPTQQEEDYNSYRQWKDDHEERLKSAIRDLVPEVGTRGTAVYWSDRRAVTVTEVITPSKVKVRFNKTRCINYYTSEYEILPEIINELWAESVFTKRRNGRWVEEGQSSKDGVMLALLYHEHYIDPNF